MYNLEDYDEQMEEMNIKYINAEIDDTIKNFMGYLSSPHNVKKCLDEKTTEIYSAILLSIEHRDCDSAYSITGCDTFAEVLFELNNDIEMSIFLSIHGMYRPANVLLRRWLETTIYAFEYDSMLKNSRNRNKYEDILGKSWDWLEKAPSNIKLNGTVNKDGFIDDEIDNIAKQLLKEKSYFEKSSYLFSWDEIPINDGDRIIEFLKKELKIKWAKTENIRKIDGNKTIIVSNETKSLSLKLNDEISKVILEIDNGKVYEFTVKTKNGKLIIYASFKKYIIDIYNDLSKSAHYDGINIFGNYQPEYNKELFEEWYLKLNQINEICNILILLKFPEMLTLNKKHKETFPSLELNQMKMLRGLFKK